MSGKDILAVLAVILGAFVLLAIVFLVSRWGGWRGWGMLGYMPMMGYGTILGFFFIPILLVLLGTGVYYALRGIPSVGAGERNRALEIIKERYARGEITKDQYEQLKKDLE